MDSVIRMINQENHLSILDKINGIATVFVTIKTIHLKKMFLRTQNRI